MDTAPAPAVDPRIAKLVQLVTGLTAEYTNLASRVLERLDGSERAEALEHVQKISEEVRAALGEIAAMPTEATP